MTLTRDQILGALDAWIRQRPGLEFGNYGNAASYREESRRITRQKHDAETLLRAVRWRESITADMLAAAFRDAFSGRLTLTEKDGKARLDYCTGQYFPTEYRAAACAVLASALWNWTREYAMPAPRRIGDDHGRDCYLWGTREYLYAGDWLRRHFRREFGPRLASRWFD